MANMFLLAKMRQPSRLLYKGLEVNAFSDFLDELLSDRNFLMEGGDDDNLILRLCMEEGFSIKDSLWHTLADKEHRMQHWILKLTIANSRQESSKMQKMEQRLATLENRLKNLSLSPRRQQNQRALPAPSQHALMPPQQMLALPASGTQQKGKSKGEKGSKGKGKGKGNKTQSSNSSSTQGFRNFQALYKKLGWSVRKHFQKDTCWKFQSNVCQDASCPRKHACVGCGKENVHYNSCGCMESTTPRA